jgi:hypothetical protein
MGAQLERLTRLVSPVTLLIGALLFLLPFCAVTCNGAFGAGSSNVISASGANLVTGADVTPDCAALNQAVTALGSSIANAIGGAGAGAAIPSQVVNCGTNGSSSTSTGSGGLGGILGSGNPIAAAAAAANTKLGPFEPSSTSGQVHVDRQPLAIAAVALLVLGAVLALLRGRLRAILAGLAALGAAGCLVALRATLNSSFSDDLRKAAAVPSGVSSALGLPDPTSLFSLTWGLGWTLALVAAVIAAAVNLVSVLATGTTPAPARAAPPPAANAPGAPAGAWTPPPGADPVPVGVRDPGGGPPPQTPSPGASPGAYPAPEYPPPPPAPPAPPEISAEP